MVLGKTQKTKNVGTVMERAKYRIGQKTINQKK